MEPPPPTADETKSAKKKRYDRQLRLWGEHGQEAMESSNICLINGSASGSETLKNLVLPGIGSFTIVDGAVVSVRDLGNNFFVDESCVGKPRAQCVTALLQELNEHVVGAYVAEDISSVLAARPDFLQSFTMVIATQLRTSDLATVSSLCTALRIPLIVLHTYGFMGYLRLALGEHQVVETHPDHGIKDLRVLHPPAAMRALIGAKYADLAALPNAEYAHVPYVVLLVKAVDAWREANGGRSPAAYKEKKEVKALIEGYRRAELQADVNIDEALAAANTALSSPEPSSSLKATLGGARARVSSLVADWRSRGGHHGFATGGAAAKHQLGFWCMAAAVEAFVGAEGRGLLPVEGTLPDMTSDTAGYVALQALYAGQAAADLGAVSAHLRALEAAEGLPPTASTDELKRFCKHAHGLTVQRYRPLEDELAGQVSAPALRAALADEASSGGGLYLLLRAAQAFRAERGCWPGEADADAVGDVGALKRHVAAAALDLGLGGAAGDGGGCPVGDALIGEFCRWGGGEMHSIASVMGGIASQEAIKAATHQYVPLNNTFVFNGSSGITASLEL